MATRSEKKKGDKKKGKYKAWRFSAVSKEDHGMPIYCVAFCDFGAGYSDYFATVGGNQVRNTRSTTYCTGR